MNQQALEELPAGTGFLMAQFGADTVEEADRQAHAMLEALGDTEHDPDVAFMDDPHREDELWQVREAGLGATAHVPGRPDTFEGWEDSAVPVDRLGDYLRDLRRLYEEFGYASDTGPSLYGHFGQGCVHTRIPFDLYSTEGVATYRRFMERAADLVARTAARCPASTATARPRGELLPRMFGDEVVGLFGEVKALFDPQDRMNPGKVVAPRAPGRPPPAGRAVGAADLEPLFFGYPDDGGSFRQAANRCVGVGKCRKHENDGGTVMCPSYQVDPRGGALHPGPGPAPVRDARRARGRPGHRRLALDRGQGRPRPVPGVQGLQDRLSGQRGHGDVQGGVPRPPLPPPAAAARRLRHRLAAGCGRAGGAHRPARVLNALTRHRAVGAAG